MGLQETMAAIAAKPLEHSTYADVLDADIFHIRLDFDPVGIRFCLDAEEIVRYPVNARARVTEMGGPSGLGKGGQPWSGMDVCKGCPLFKLEVAPSG